LPRPAELEKRLGYRFTDQRLLAQALASGRSAVDFQRLEFLGDGVLGCVIAEVLLTRFPKLDQGKLSQMRAGLVRESTLVDAAQSLGLAQGSRASTRADTVEALFGAVFLDGGYEAARRSVLQVLAEALERLDPAAEARDAKTRLQEILQARFKSVPAYRVTHSSGAAHERSFEVECRVEELSLATSGTGTSRQRAEQAAAVAMLKQVKKA
jgi:ribonuclease III